MWLIHSYRSVVTEGSLVCVIVQLIATPDCPTTSAAKLLTPASSAAVCSNTAAFANKMQQVVGHHRKLLKPSWLLGGFKNIFTFTVCLHASKSSFTGRVCCSLTTVVECLKFKPAWPKHHSTGLPTVPSFGQPIWCQTRCIYCCEGF